MPEFHVHQSLPICIALASLGGMFEVAATASTALPSVREQQGYLVKPFHRWLAVIANVLLQGVGGLFSCLLATWFGPVSIVLPFQICATLLTNMLIFGVLMGVETFERHMRVGTHVIVLAVILLPVVGPTVSPDQTFDELIQNWYSILWFAFLFVIALITSFILVFHASPTNTDPETNRFLREYTLMQRTIVLLLCRSSANAVDLTVSRFLILNPPKWVMGVLVATKLWSGNLCTYTVVVQSYSVKQNKHVPLNATMLMLVNALTGLMVWEDQPQSWYGYFCVFWLLGIGCDLLLKEPDLLTPENLEFGTNKSANILIAEGRRKFSTGDDEGIKKLMLDNSDFEGLLCAETPEQLSYQSINHLAPRSRIDSIEGSLSSTMSSLEAWSEVIGKNHKRRRARSADLSLHQDFAYVDTQVIRQTRTPSPLPTPTTRIPSNTSHMPDFPRIPNGRQLAFEDDVQPVLEVVPSSSSLASIEQEGAQT